MSGTEFLFRCGTLGSFLKFLSLHLLSGHDIRACLPRAAQGLSPRPGRGLVLKMLDIVIIIIIAKK